MSRFFSVFMNRTPVEIRRQNHRLFNLTDRNNACVAEPVLHEDFMPTLVPQPTRIQAAGNKPKLIREYIGRVNTQTDAVSIALMNSPGGWVEPGQRPEFDEYTLVLKGLLRVEHEGGAIDVAEGQAVMTRAGEWIRYSTPSGEGAEYVAVCVPAFGPDSVHRDS
jgi:mannose-6-phosphate isomerase-like protein (cupin superfamily)